jgi:hypothetical protein
MHVVERCLEKRPHERFQTALDVLNELRSVRRMLESGVSSQRPRSDKVASIAVLPFVNRSASADDEYFSDGLADELLNVLAKIKGLRVVARTSSFQFKGTKDDITPLTKEEWETHLGMPCREDVQQMFEDKYGGDPKARLVTLNKGAKSAARSRIDAGASPSGIADFTSKQ